MIWMGCLPVLAAAQDTTATATLKEASYLQAGLAYSSDVVFAGRKDSVAVPYLIPLLSYYHSSGLFVQSTFSILTRPEGTGLDLVTLSAGFMGGKVRFGWGLMAGKYYFNEQSYNVQSALSGYANAYAGYAIANTVNTYAEVMLSFGEYSDFFTGMEVSYLLYAAVGKLQITPTVYGMMGTLYYYDQYYTTRRTIGGVPRGRGPGAGGGTTTTSTLVVNESSTFRLLSLELSLPVRVEAGKFRFIFPQCTYCRKALLPSV